MKSEIEELTSKITNSSVPNENIERALKKNDNAV